MRFLADESCDFTVVRALRTAGHDVMVVVESAPAAEDQDVITLAVREGRILLSLLAQGVTTEAILEDYPDLEPDDIRRLRREI